MTELVLFGGLRGLWRTDGTLAGTAEIPVKVSLLAPTGFASLKGKVLFSGYSTTLALPGRVIWQTDGTTKGTVELKVNGGDPKAGGVAGHLVDFASLHGRLLFRGMNADNHLGLWQTDGTAAGTVEIKNIGGANANGLSPGNFALLNGNRLFQGNNAHGHFVLWQTDGTSAGTREIPVSGAGPNNLNTLTFALLNNRLFCLGINALGHQGLWQTDGTSAGTREIPVAGARPGALGGFCPGSFVLLNNKILFRGANAADHWGLWQTDGTSRGTMEIPVGGVGPKGLLDTGGELTLLNKNKVLFRGTNAGSHVGLWQTDGTSAGEIPIKDAGANFSPGWFALLNDKLLFQATNARGWVGLWQTDGTCHGTTEIPVVTKGGLYPNHLASVHLG